MPNRKIQHKADLGAPTNPVRDARRRIEALFVSPRAVHPVASGVSDLDQWRSRRLEANYAMVFFDSLVVTTREQGLLRSSRIHLALGILADGTKDIIDHSIEHPSAVHSWPSMMTRFHTRGVVEFGIAVAEHDAALIAVRNSFPDVRVFQSIQHLVQASMECLQAAERGPYKACLLRFFVAADPAVTLADLAALPPLQNNPAVAAFWRRHWDQLLPIIAMPRAVRDVLCTTSAVESVTEKLRRRGIAKRNSFASPEAAIRELLLVLQDANACWKVSPQKWAAARAELLNSQDEHGEILTQRDRL